MRKEERNHFAANREVATALFNREDHYFFKPTQQKVNTTPHLRRNSTSTVPNGIVRTPYGLFTMNTPLFSPCEKWKEATRGLINLPWCSHAVALLPLSAVVHRTGYILFMWHKEDFPCRWNAIYCSLFLEMPMKFHDRNGECCACHRKDTITYRYR